MRLFRLFFFPPPRREPMADRFVRLLAAVGRPGAGVSRVLFYFADAPHLSVSGVQRILRAYPQTAAFADRDTLNNYPPPWTPHNPNRPEASLPPEVLEEILRGIPRRFPLFRAAVIFDGVDWTGTGQGLAAGPASGERDPRAPIDWDYRFPSVSISASPGDEYPAVVECADPSAQLDAATAGKLERIGRIVRQDVRTGFTADELGAHLRRKAEAEAFVTAFKARQPAWLGERVRLPHAWPG